MADGSGDVVQYVPVESGPHQIYITYGDLDVAGRNEFNDSSSHRFILVFIVAAVVEVE